MRSLHTYSPFRFFLVLSFFALGTSKPLLAQAGKASTVPVVATEDADTLRARAILERATQQRQTTRSIYQDSIIIAFEGEHTVVPVGSVLHLPDAFRERISEEPVGRLVLWPTFLKTHSSWIRTQELSAQVVQGDQPLPAPVARQITYDPKLVIAVYQHNPVTVWEQSNSESSHTSTQLNKSP